MAKTCPSCGAPIDATAETCPYCGAVIPKEVKQPAIQVATPVAPIIVQQQVHPQRVKKNNRDKTTAAVITLLLGGLGIDYFYLGNNKNGIITLLIVILTGGFGLMITGIIALVNFIKLLAMSQEDFDNKYNY